MALEVSQGVILKKVIAIYFFISVILFYLDHKFCKDDKLILTKNKQTNKQQTSDFSDFSLFSEVDLDCFLKHRDLTLLQYTSSLLLREVYLLTVESVQNQEGMSCFIPACLFSPTIALDISTEPFLVAQMVKNLPAMQETWVQPLSWEDPLEKGMATHISVFAWRIPWMEEPDGL